MLQSFFHDDSIAHNETWRLMYFGIALVMIAFGIGGIKANLPLFGADQFQKQGPRALQTFFNWFYGFNVIGVLIALTVVVYVQQKHVFHGYCIAAGTMFLAVITFVAGRNKYLNKPPDGSQLTETVQIIYSAVKNRGTANAKMWLDRAKSSFGGKYTEAQVEDVKALLGVFQVFIFFAAYWTICYQVSGLFYCCCCFLLKTRKFTTLSCTKALSYIFLKVSLFVV